MVTEYELKKEIVAIGRRIYERGYVASNDGNITVLLNDKELLTTPTGVSKGFMTEDMIIKCDREGNMIQGNSKYRPSSEVKMHLDVYKERPDVRSVVHAHPPYATSFAVAGIPLDKCVLPEAIVVMGSVPIAPYGLPSTMEIPDAVRPLLKNSDVILLENHGALTVGKNLLDAYHKMETLEHTASIVWKAIQLGNVNVMPGEERERLMDLRNKFGLTGNIASCSTTPLFDKEHHIEAQQFQGVGEYGGMGSSNSSPSPKNNGVSEDDISDIVRQVMARLQK